MSRVEGLRRAGGMRRVEASLQGGDMRRVEGLRRAGGMR